MNEIFIDGIRWYTYQQLAKSLNKNVRIVYNLRDAGKVETMKVDGLTFYRMKGDVDNG